MYYMHFGIYPTGDEPVTIQGLAVSPTEETLLSLEGTGIPEVAAVRGSWSCWGTKDQETDGDESLHVEVSWGGAVVTLSPVVVEAVYDLLVASVENGRVLDHVYISGKDHSELIYVVTLNGTPRVIFHSARTIKFSQE